MFRVFRNIHSEDFVRSRLHFRPCCVEHSHITSLKFLIFSASTEKLSEMNVLLCSCSCVSTEHSVHIARLQGWNYLPTWLCNVIVEIHFLLAVFLCNRRQIRRIECASLTYENVKRRIEVVRHPGGMDTVECLQSGFSGEDSLEGRLQILGRSPDPHPLCTLPPLNRQSESFHSDVFEQKLI